MDKIYLVKLGAKVFDRTSGKYVYGSPTINYCYSKVTSMSLQRQRDIFGNIDNNVIVVRNAYPMNTFEKLYDFIIFEDKPYRLITSNKYNGFNKSLYFSTSNDDITNINYKG